ncbi:MAG: hypothetical protein WCK09_03850 [Bacteroidota bacterium]
MMQQSYPGINPSISDWKGQEITDLQEELLRKVNAHISEKWFYTHMKSTHPTLPRIDVLNLLSRYVGYANWDDFVFQHQEMVPHAATLPKTGNKYFYWVPALVILSVVIFYGVFSLLNTREYRFRFVDADTREPITNMKISVRLLLKGESPVDLLCDTSGTFTLKTDKSVIKMVVNNPYYRTDTITRVMKKLDNGEIISLHANDFALMIHYFSLTNIADWEKRRSKLDHMIDDTAMICQVIGEKGPAGMELLTKAEFIDKLTMPSGSLKDLEILDTRFRNDRISVLKFRVNSKHK